jgi:hypothetical protein
MVERPPKVQIPFIVIAWPFVFAMMAMRDSGPWVVALIVYALVGGMNAINYWPIAYRTPLIEIAGRFTLVAVGALATALICALVTTGNVEELFTRVR